MNTTNNPPTTNPDRLEGRECRRATCTPANLAETTDIAAPAPAKDCAPSGTVADTTWLLARQDVVRYIRSALYRHGVKWRDLADAVGEVQADALEKARTGRMPASASEWKALAAKIAVCWAIDRLREAEARAKHDTGLCDDADVYAHPMLHREQRDPVDTKRYLAILKDLFDSGQMPEDGEEILWGEAEGVPQKEIAAELGVSESAVKNRLFRMRATFRAKLASLGMLTFLMLLVGVIFSPVGDVAAPPPPRPAPVESAPRDRCLPKWDAGAPIDEKSSEPARPNCVVSD